MPAPSNAESRSHAARELARSIDALTYGPSGPPLRVRIGRRLARTRRFIGALPLSLLDLVVIAWTLTMGGLLLAWWLR